MTEVVGVILQFMPFFFLLLLANGAENPRLREQGRRKGPSLVLGVISYVLLSLSFGFLFLGGLLFSFLGWIAQNGKTGPFLTFPGAPPELTQKITDSLPMVGASFWVPSLLGLLLLIPAVRRGVSKIIPIDPFNRVHTVSLSSTMFIWIYFFFFVSIGLEAITELTSGQKATNPMPSLWAQQITFFLLALIGTGWLTRRRLRDVFRRLGLHRPKGRHLLIGVGSGLILVLGALSLESLARSAGFPNDPHAQKLTEELLGPLYGSVWGILTLGLSAALGEEAVFRGALLPRFGLFLTSLLFAVVHSNYGLSISTVIVFLVGLALGLLRRRYDTTTTMFVHATYNMTLGLMAFFST
ncbi:CAAX prenyl protease-like protein [Melghirimyces profundicolus]|uniref:CAAX prenyl protease-like protein n=1 Tax=Melghirimyces profundicolus TaxID=1242148 RepID=A0A2T6C2F2_9BACL|nr:type II CAAX endopeptidase family protein [Melghirimyces profundicolus]PTX62496.1 CAAX prenyl protease-like protein [Melghirimyces profundicolus]